jgi:membrane protein insertase Oxa1/YidC/SpoIIIJ
MPGIEALFIYPITTLIEVVFVCMQKIFREAGLSVIVVSCVISALCLPMYAAAERVQRREREARQRMAAGIAKIKAAFSGDERFMLLSAYYRQNRYHPAYALRSSFGLLIQIPFFIAGYAYLSHLQALHGASFLFIRDLGAPDALLPLPFVVGGGEY